MASEYATRMITGAITFEEISLVRERTKVGDTVKWLSGGEQSDNVAKGTVIAKYQHHCLCDNGLKRESVKWVDIIRGKNK